MKLTNAEALEHIVHKIEQELEEHSKWLKLWNSRAICHLPFPQSYLTEQAHRECSFAEWFQSCRSEEWLHQMDFDSIVSIHKSMHDEARNLAEKVESNQPINEADYFQFVNNEWSFTQRLQRLKDKINRLQISFDPLTGVFNRQAMMPILLQEQAYVERDGKQCCIAMADLDHFKEVNDTFGHANGDTVLKSVASFFRNNLRPYDALFRYGGEEFLFCLPNTDIFTSKRLLDRLRADLEKMPIRLSMDSIVSVTVSMGMIQMASDCPVEDSIERADQALYTAKNSGRNKVCVWNQSHDSPLSTLI